MTALQKVEKETFSLSPRNYQEALQYSEILSKSDLVPKDYRGKPGNCLIAVQMGIELGLQPMAAIQNIAVINGRPSLWGDAMLAVCRPHIDIKETFNKDSMTAICQIKRRGDTEWHQVNFSKEDAELANLWGKAGPWKQYPKRMLQLRARGFALRDSCPDLLRGISSAEEQEDIIRVTGDSPPPPKVQSKVTEVVEVRAVEDSPKIKDHDQYKDIIEAIEIYKLEEKMKTITKGQDWHNFDIARFDGLFKVVRDIIDEEIK